MSRPDGPAGRSATALPWTALVTGATVLAWLGLFIHNLADLPEQTILSPESLYPTLVTLAFLALWLLPPTRRLGSWLLALWALLNLVGGAMTVLPLPVLPFVPDQSLEHYAFHALYAVCQLPLIAVCAAWLRRARHTSRRRPAGGASP